MYGRPMARRLLAPTILALALVPATIAEADVRTKTDSGGSKGGGPALDIARLTAVGNANGLLVTARMKGNFERAMGRGRLRRAGLALLLRPRTRSARPAILATTGRTADVDTLLRTRSQKVGVARRGREVDFVIGGGGLEQVGRIQVKSFRRVGPARARAAEDIRITPAQADFLLDEGRGDLAEVDVPGLDDTCEELRATVIGANEALDRLRARPPSSEDAFDAISDLAMQTELALARRCGTGLAVACTGYRHFERSSAIAVDFSFDPVFTPHFAAAEVRIE